MALLSWLSLTTNSVGDWAGPYGVGKVVVGCAVGGTALLARRRGGDSGQQQGVVHVGRQWSVSRWSLRRSTP